MHATPAVMLGCTDCHGGNAAVRGDPALGFEDPAYVAARERAHVLPRYPKSWHYPSSANPQRTYTLLNREAPEFVRFVNPSDYRSEEHTSELQSLMRISYAVFCLKKKTKHNHIN